MTSTIKKTLFCSLIIILNSCIINNPKQEECIAKEITVTKILETGGQDLVFHDEGTDFYYINRGLENGFTIEKMNEKVLGKKVTLHLYKFWFGTESEHIS